MQLHRDPPGFALQGSSASALPPSFPLATHQLPRQKEADWALKGGKKCCHTLVPGLHPPQSPWEAEGKDALSGTLSTQLSRAHHKCSQKGCQQDWKDHDFSNWGMQLSKTLTDNDAGLDF